ncbi:MAG TPA: hypothetical protein DCX22_03975 [Dehalococcoidia bacterium]|nr:hypothetical protein [Dehalococcoidia bacterium]
MQPRAVICPKCRTPNAPGDTLCRRCGTRICPKCFKAVPPRLNVCPECGWRDSSWSSIEIQVPSKGNTGVAYTKKLTFKCPQCGSNVADEDIKCPRCGHIGLKQLRDHTQIAHRPNNGHRGKR